jgi:hypothetical protein
MAEKMPEALREHFEAKEKQGEGGKHGDEKSKAGRKEALRKAQKAKMKRNAEKESGKR